MKWIKGVECVVFTRTVRLIVPNTSAGFSMVMFPVSELI